MKKSIILILTLFILIKISLADVIINYELSTEIIVNQLREIDVEIYNNNSFDILNVKFSDLNYFSFPNKFNMTENQTVIKKIGLLSNIPFSSQSFSTTFSFNTLTQGAKEPETKPLFINLTSISNNDLQIFKNDKVRFNNIGDSNITIETNESVFIFEIEPSSSKSRTFTDIGDFSYIVKESGFIGRIKILDNIIDQFIHDPKLDKSLPFTLTSKNIETTFTMVAILSDPIMQFNQTIERILLFETNGTVIGVELTADKWITFDENNFDFTDSKIVNYEIKPSINSSGETNKVHPITIRAESENAGEITITNNVFIIPHNFTEVRTVQNTTIIFLPPDETIIDAYCKFRPTDCLTDAVVIEYCKANPEACPKQEVLKNRTLTTEGQSLTNIENQNNRILNKMTTLEGEKLPPIVEAQEDIKNRISTLENRQNEFEIKTEEENEKVKKKKFWSIFRWTVAIILITLIISGFIFWDWLDEQMDFV